MSRLWYAATWVGLLVLTGVLFGCGSDDENHADFSPVGTWQLSAVRSPEGIISEPQENYTLTFSKHAAESGPKGWQTFELFDGCNTCSGDYSTEDSSLESTLTECSLVACDPEPPLSGLLHDQVEGQYHYWRQGPTLTLTAPDSQSLDFIDPERLPPGFLVLRKGGRIESDKPFLEVIENAGDFSALWEELCGSLDHSCVQPIPAVDFDRYSVLAFFFSVNGGVYSWIGGIDVGVQGTVVEWVWSELRGECGYLANISPQYEVIRIPKLNGPVNIKTKTVTRGCD